MIASCTSSGRSPPRSTAALIATAPRSLAESAAKSPCIAPIGVRAAPTMTIGSFNMGISFASFDAAVQRAHDSSSRPRQLEVDGVRDGTLLDLFRKTARLARFHIEIYTRKQGD